MTYAAEECRTARESGTVEVMDAVFRKTILGYNEAVSNCVELQFGLRHKVSSLGK